MTATSNRPLAVVTGASSGIGYELAVQFAEHGYDLLVAAEDSGIEDAALRLRARGVEAKALRTDLATYDGVERLVAEIDAAGRPLDAAAINAGVGVNGPFLERDLASHIDLIDLNVISPVHLAHRILPAMVQRGAGRVLFTSSIAATMPGPFESTYNASKAFLKSFAEAIREELKDSGVTITVLMPGATETNFFERAGAMDTRLGQAEKDDPAEVARQGFEALLAGKDHVVAGSFKNKVQATMSHVLPDTADAAIHRKQSEPGSGTEKPKTRKAG
jgi:short-subunit dehydrogenase